MLKKRFLPIFIIILLLLATLYGCSALGSITITYDSVGGSKIASRTLASDATELELPTPTKEGYIFEGWYYDAVYSSSVDKTSIPTESITLYAKWTIIQITLTFVADGSDNQYAYVNYGEGLAVSAMPSVPAKEGYSGVWLTTDLNNLTSNVIIYAQYTLNDGSIAYYVSDQDVDSQYTYLTVDGVSNSGYKIYSYSDGTPDTAITAPSVNPVKEGYYFLGWYYDKEHTEKCTSLPSIIPYSSLSLYAHFMDVSNMSKYITYVADGSNLRITGLTSQGKLQDTIVIPSAIDGKTVTSIGYENEGSNSVSTLKVFNSAYLVSLTIPETVTRIGSFALAGCTRLKTFTVDGNNLLSIGTGAFAGCSVLAEINIPDSVTTIGSYAFAGITTVDNGTTRIIFTNGEAAWSSLNDWYYTGMALNKINISEQSSLSNLKSFAFVNTSLLTSISLPNSITEVNYAMFDGSNMSDIIIYDGNTDLINIGDAIYSVDGKTLYYYPVNGAAAYTLNSATTQISANAFRNSKTLTGLTVNNNLESIGNYAFADATVLASLNINASCALTAIGNYAFNNCTSLVGIALPSDFNSMGEGAFKNCSSLDIITFSGDVLGAVPKYAFYNCSALYEITLPDNILSIGDYAFYNCSSLTNLGLNDIDPIMTSIGKYAFSECTSLEPISLPYTLQTIGSYAFASIDGTMVVGVDLYNTQLINVGEYAFLNCMGMSVARLPDTITSIGEGVFKNCTNLTSASLTSATLLNTVPKYLFYNCFKINNTVIFPANFTTIGDYAFYGCTLLSQITLNSVENIGTGAFENCTSLKEGTTSNQYILPAYLETMGERAFANCSSLTGIHIPNTLLTISKEAFANCTLLTDITYNSGYILTTLSENSFANCTSLTSFEIPSTLTTRTVNSGFIKNPFYGCSGLMSFVSNTTNTNNLVITDGIVFEKTIVYNTTQLYSIYAYPTGRADAYQVSTYVTKIDDYAFYGCSIPELTFAQSTPVDTVENITMISIGDYAFANSSALESVNISKRVYEVGEYAFYNCKLLNSVIIDATYAADGEQTATAGVYYAVTDGIDNNLLTLKKYSFSNIAITGLTIAPRITNINEGAFSNCYSLLEVDFTDSFDSNLLSIGDYAFYSDSGLTSLELPVQLETIGDYAFAYCVNVIDITFNTSSSANNGNGIALNVGNYAFSNCHFLYTLNLPSSLNSLGEGVFSYNSRLKYVNFAETLRQTSLAIPDKAFFGDAGIESIEIPGYISAIGNYAFCGLSLDTVIFENGTVDLDIGDYSFANLNKLTAISLPDRLISIGNHTFENSNISTLSYSNLGNSMTVGDYAFSNMKITAFTVYSRITAVGAYCFSSNTQLTTINYLGHSSLLIDDYTFYNSKITTISIDVLPSSILIGSHAFDNTSSLATITTDSSAYTLDASTITIGDYAFYKSAITSMSIKATDLTIGNYAFNSTKLTSFIVNETANILSVGSLGIANNSALTTLTLNATTSINSLSEGFASYNIKLQTITLTDPSSNYTVVNGVVYNGTTLLLYPAGKVGATYQATNTTVAIADYAFAGNTLLCNLLLDSGVTIVTKQALSFDSTASNLTFFAPSDLVSGYINNWAVTNFSYISTNLNGLVLKLLINGRYSLEKYTGVSTNITVNSTIIDGDITYNIVSIADKAFNHNISITSLTLGDGIETIGKYAFANCSNLTTVVLGKMLLTIDINAFQNCVKLTDISFNSGLTYINKYAFDGCTLLNNVILPDSLLIIGQYAFNNCASLTDIDLGEGVTTLEDNSFANCISLITISIPESVNAINSYVFANCATLSFVYLYSTTIPTLAKNGFAQTLNGLRILVPQRLENSFLSATNWRDYSGKVLPIEYICTEEGYENYIIENISGNNYRLVGYMGTESTVNLASVLGSKHLVEIDSYAINQFATSIILAEGFLTIGDYAFVYASNLTGIEIASTVTSIGDYAFYGITSLSSAIIRDFVDSKIVTPALITIGDYAFYNTSIAGIIIPAHVTSIGSYAFSSSSTAHLITAVFEMTSTGILTIGSYAFMNNTDLITLTFNCFVDRIGAGAFNNCTKLRSIYFNSTGVNSTDSTSTKTPSETIFSNCYNLSVFVKQLTVQTSFKRDWGNANDKEKILLSENVVQDNNNSVVYVYDSGSQVIVDTVNYFVVEKLSSSTVSIKNYIGEYTGRYIDSNNPQLDDPKDTDITIPTQMIIGGTTYTVVAISSYAFNNKITSVTIPNTVTNISSYAFYKATSLKYVYFSGTSKLSAISNYAFSDCTQLIGFTIPKSVTSVGDYAFNNCTSLASVTFEELNSSDILSTLMLRAYVFNNCTALTSVTIPKHAVNMGNGIFSGATRLANVSFDSSLSQMKTIGTYAFRSTALESITFPQALEGLGDYSFDSCAKLKYVYLTRMSTGSVLTTTGSNVFNNINNPFIRVYVPFTSYASYAVLDGWKTKSVLADQNDDSGLFNYILNGTTATITNYLGISTTVNIPSQLQIDGVYYRITSINPYAGNYNITKVTFDDTSYLSTLYSNAFANCINLREIHLPDTLTVISENAFYNCTSLTDITLPTGISGINSRVFYKCTSLKEIILPSNITEIGEAAFGMCSSLNRVIIECVTLPVESLGTGAFSGVNSHFVIVVPTELETNYKNEWYEYEDVIYSRDEMYGDFIVTVDLNQTITVVQYNGYIDGLNYNEITIKGKVVVAVAENAYVDETLTYILD